MKKLIRITVLAILVSGCATSRWIGGNTTIRDYTLNAPRQKIFDVALTVAQTKNLDVAVLEKQSGLIRFEIATLSPAQLDEYCVYPYENSKTNQSWDTFTNWNNRSLGVGGGSVSGKLSLTLLVSDNGSTSSVNLRSNWIASNRAETAQCSSNGKFEENFIDEIKKRL